MIHAMILLVLWVSMCSIVPLALLGLYTEAIGACLLTIISSIYFMITEE